MGLVRNLQRRIAAGYAVSRPVRPSAVKSMGSGGVISFDSDYGWRPLNGSRWYQTYTGSNIDWTKEAGPLWENPAIAICLGFMFDKIVEAPLTVQSKKDGKGQRTEVPDSPLLAQLARPNPEYGWKVLLQATALSLKLKGDGYWIKARNLGGAGPVKEWYYAPHWEMQPVAPDDGGPTQVYKRTQGKLVTFIPKSDVIHFRTGSNPRNMREGWSRFLSLFREVVSDNEIALYTSSVLRNLGVFGSVVSPADPDAEIEADQADELKRRIRDSSTGDMRGDVFVSNVALKVQKAGFSPQELAIGDMGRRPEARICAGFGFNPMALGFPSENMKYANLKEARAACWEDSLIPMLSIIAEALTDDALEEALIEEGEIVAFDYSPVRDLMPDKIAEEKRARDNWWQGGTTLNELRKALGFPEDKSPIGGKYVWQLLKVKMPVAADAPGPDAELDNPDDGEGGGTDSGDSADSSDSTDTTDTGGSADSADKESS